MSVLLQQNGSTQEEEVELTGEEQKAAEQAEEKMHLLRKCVCSLCLIF